MRNGWPLEILRRTDVSKHNVIRLGVGVSDFVHFLSYSQSR